MSKNMAGTFRTAFALKNSYRANSVIYSLKQVPLLKRILPERLYGFQDLKVLAYIIAAVWELVTAFAGKFLYLLILSGICLLTLKSGVPAGQALLHMLVLLTACGAFVNTYLFNPTKDKYYAVMLMRMDAGKYALTDYGYAVLKVIAGFLPFTLIFGTLSGVPVWICILIPFSVAGAKLMAAALMLYRYEKTGIVRNENQLGKAEWIVVALLNAAAFLFRQQVWHCLCRCRQLFSPLRRPADSPRFTGLSVSGILKRCTVRC